MQENIYVYCYSEGVEVLSKAFPLKLLEGGYLRES